MKPQQHIAFRLDASVAIGVGHLMRCLALADVLRAGGAQTTLILRGDLATAKADVEARGHACHLLPAQAGDVSWRVDAQQTLDCLATLSPPDCLVVDHYGLDAGWESLIKPAVRRIMVIDDLADRPHDCDILLDQNFNSDMATRYVGLVPQHCRQLLGPQFAMLRPEFIAARAQARERDGMVRRLAIFFGGTDPGGDTLKALTAFRNLQDTSAQFAQLHCDVIVGSGNPQRDQIERLCRDMPQVRFLCQISNMAQIMDAADVCIGAGGTALWERAVLGVPSLVMAVADNQVSATEAMARQGALLYLGRAEQVNAKDLQQAMRFVFGNPWLLQSLSRHSAAVVDGQGVVRVAGCIGGS